MKKIIILILSIAFSLTLSAQQTGPQISWKSTVFDFGEIQEEGGIQTAKFEFINTGNEPLYLTNVKPSCGCTATDFSKEPVKTGETGYVIATYNPSGRPGQFSKAITVTTNEFQPSSVIRITGKVIPKAKKEEELPEKE